MTSRDQFELWVGGTTNSDLHRSIMLCRHENGNYNHLATNHKWEAWQASRAAIEVDTPDFIDQRTALNKGYTVDYSNGFGDAMDAYELAIEQAGLEVKK